MFRHSQKSLSCAWLKMTASQTSIYQVKKKLKDGIFVRFAFICNITILANIL